jgi:hypothetical protein
MHGGTRFTRLRLDLRNIRCPRAFPRPPTLGAVELIRSVWLLACAGPSATPSAGGQLGAASAGASAPAAAAREAEWDQPLAAAKRGGRVVIAAPTGETYRVPLTAF